MDNYVEILLVEDNPNDAELTLMTLKEKKLGNNIVWLKNGAEALDFLFADGEYADRSVTDHPKVVLLDLKMPKVGGIEVLRKIREDDRTRKMPVVVMTSSNEESDIIESYDLGVNSYIVKPVGFEDFAKCVEDIGLYWILVNHPPR